MRATPLSDGYREEPLWWRDTSFPEIAIRPLPREADVTVIGAGYTGLCAALALAQHGKRVVVLDKEVIGRGASGRNAGMIHAGLRRDIDWLERHRGPAGVALHTASVDACRFVASTASELAPDASWRESGWVHLAHRASATAGLREEERVRRERLGEATLLLGKAAVEKETRARGFHGALVTNNGASIHPARYLAGIARAAVASGAELHERVAVTHVAPRPAGGFTVTASGNAILAKDVLVASNGYTNEAVPQLRRRVIPIGSYIIATEPLSAAQAADISPQRRMMSDTRNFLHYWRLTPDARLLFGGRTSFTPVSLQQARDRLYHDMVGMYPQIEGIRVSHAWNGLVGFTFDQLPHLGRIGGIAFALGYCGSGVAMGSWLGHLAGEWLAGGSAPPFTSLRFPTLAGYRGHPWFLPVAGLYYSLRDSVG